MNDAIAPAESHQWSLTSWDLPCLLHLFVSYLLLVYMKSAWKALKRTETLSGTVYFLYSPRFLWPWMLKISEEIVCYLKAGSKKRVFIGLKSKERESWKASSKLRKSTSKLLALYILPTHCKSWVTLGLYNAETCNFVVGQGPYLTIFGLKSGDTSRQNVPKTKVILTKLIEVTVMRIITILCCITNQFDRNVWRHLGGAASKT